MESEVSEKPNISLKEMDAAVKHVRDLRDAYKAASALSNAAHAELKTAEMHLINMLTEADKDVYIVDGVGRVRVSREMSIQTPKTPQDKVAFFAWLARTKGQDVADAYMSINANSLNALYNELTAEAASRGEILMPEGLGEPIERVSLSLTKA